MDKMEIKERIQPYTESRRLAKFGKWKEKSIFPEVLDALLGRSFHTVFAINPDGSAGYKDESSRLIAIKREGYQYPHYFLDVETATVYCQFMDQ